MEKKIVMMIMMDGAMIAEKVLISLQKEEDWSYSEGPSSEDAEYFFY